MLLSCVICVWLISFACGSDIDTCRLTYSGWVCGVVRNAENGVQYLSFRGIPYAQQPLGELRFKELQPLEPWDDIFNATEDGPICPQYDEVYSRMANPQKGMSEACIHANVHVPLVAENSTDLPVFVFIHGGGFQAGSGNSDMHGPEYLVSKGMIVITFNYRLNFFGFFCMNNEFFPGNNGLRDMYTLLRWVQTNAKAFGGNPNDVTLAGQSGGAASAHLISLSNATTNMFNKIILMSGTGIPAFFNSAPSHALQLANNMLDMLGINSTDPEYIHDQLISMPLETIMEANSKLQTNTGLVSFVPVAESPHAGFTTILDAEPTKLIQEGRGKEIPLIIGFSSIECEFFKQRLHYLNITGAITEDPSAILPAGLSGVVSKMMGTELGQRVMARYFNGTPTLDEYLTCCTDTLFIYPAFKLAQWRARLGGAPVYMYEFSYDSAENIVKNALMLKYEDGGAHVEDLTYIFRFNSVLNNEKSFPPRTRDDLMRFRMTEMVANFNKCGMPFCDNASDWTAVNETSLNYQSLVEPLTFKTSNMAATSSQRDMIAFFDDIHMTALNQTSY